MRSKTSTRSIAAQHHEKIYLQNVYLKPESKLALPSAHLDFKKAYKIPIAHGEGNFFAPDEVLMEMDDNDQVMFRYCNAEGKVTEESNPNGSVENIAGICNKEKNVFGMMPHPERASDLELDNTDGREIFESILAVVNA
ncbi:MAG: phosphoribosylformylglycinamidine synthase subunit PurQ [Flavobacteriales bacterium]|nr:phosphoribosylformylglycinamidine synthase subunit PurQ [Flavobacteriales bacterium]